MFFVFPEKENKMRLILTISQPSPISSIFNFLLRMAGKYLSYMSQ